MHVIRMVKKSKLKTGLAGLVTGLIAAIALLVILLPIIMQYQQHVIKSYQLEEYTTVLQNQRKIEEKGLASCYDPSTGTINVNNTLGVSVVVILAYASDGVNEEVKYFQPGTLKIEPGINKISISDLGIKLDASRIKILKLVTSRGTIIQPPHCSKVVIVIKGLSLNMLLGGEQAPEGISVHTGSKLLVHGLINKTDSNTLVFINGTLVPRKIPGEGWAPIAFRADLTISDPNIDLTIERTDVGDYVLMVINASSYNYDRCDFGCYNAYYCYTLNNTNKEFTIHEFAYSFVSKYDDSSDDGPLKYVLVNNGYDYVIVGVEFNDANNEKKDEKKGPYNGTIYVSSAKTSINEADVVIKFFFLAEKEDKNDDQIKVRKINATLYANGNVVNATAFYRVGNKPSTQLAVLVPVEDLFNIGFEDSFWVKAVVSDCSSGTCLVDESEWISFTYKPFKLFVDSVYEKYFGE